MGGAPLMAAPAMAGASVDALPEGHSLTHHHAHDHARAVRIGTVWLVISDIIFVMALLLGFIYLKGLNTQHAFRSPHDAAPGTAGTLIVAGLALLGGIVYYWGRLGLKNGNAGQVKAGAVLAWILMLGSLVASIIVYNGLNYPVPLDAYASGILAINIYHAIHVLMAVTVGGLMLGRLRSGRLAGRDYVIRSVGYWYYWVAVSAVLMAVVLLAIK